MVLHRRELCPTVLFSRVLHVMQLESVHCGAADCANLARLNERIERLHCLFDRRVVIESMDLIQIDVIDAEAFERAVDFGVDRAFR